jgi:hypothetical protein
MLAAGLPVVIRGSVQGHVQVRHIVAQDGRLPGHLGRIAGLEGLDQTAHPLLDHPGRLAFAFEGRKPQPVLGRLDRLGHPVGPAIGIRVQEMPRSLQGVALLPGIGVSAVFPQDGFPALEPGGQGRWQVPAGEAGRDLVSLPAPGRQGPGRQQEEGQQAGG